MTDEEIAHYTKEQEIAHYTEFVQALPKGSYLYLMFAGTEDQIANEIRNDFGYPPLPEIRAAVNELIRDRSQLEKDIKTLREAVETLKTKAKEAERTTDRLTDNLRTLRSEASKAARATRYAQEAQQSLESLLGEVS